MAPEQPDGAAHHGGFQNQSQAGYPGNAVGQQAMPYQGNGMGQPQQAPIQANQGLMHI